MPKITRKTQKIFASNNPGDLGVFGSAQLGSPATSSDINTIQSAAYEQGWSDAVIDGNKRPPLEEFNGIKYVNDYQNAYLLQEGIAEYDSATNYYIGSLAKESGTSNIYKSLTDDNIGNALTDTANWEFLSNLKNSPDTVYIEKESDFPAPVGGVIPLESKTYVITGPVTITNTFEVNDPNATVVFIGNGQFAFKDQLIYTGTGTFIDGQAFRSIILVNLGIIGTTGMAKYGNFVGQGILQFSSVFMKSCILQNMSGGDYNGCGLSYNEVLFIGVYDLNTQDCRMFLNTMNIVSLFNTPGKRWLNITSSALFASIDSCNFDMKNGENPIFIDNAVNPTSVINISNTFFSGNQIDGIAAFADGGGGTTLVTAAAAPNIINGDQILIQNSANYGGVHIVSDVVAGPGGSYKIPVAFIGNDASPGNTLAVLLDGAGNPQTIDFFASTGLDQTDPIVTVSGAGGVLSDSQVVGQMNIPASVTVSIAAIGVPVVVNDANTGGTNIFSSNLVERFAFDASAGTLTFTGKSPKSVQIIAVSTVQKVGGGSDVIATLIAKNGTVIPESKQTTQSSDPTGVSSIAEVPLVTGDVISIAAQNDTSTSNVIINLSNIIVKA